MSSFRSVFLLWIIFSLVSGAAAAENPTNSAPQIISFKKIWDEAGHSAFTDLIRFDGQWLCTFREGNTHIEGEGKIRVISSQDGDQWKSVALIAEAGSDLRDPKLSIMPDHRLMLLTGATIHEGKPVVSRQPRVVFSRDGIEWSKPQAVLQTNDWLWRVTWHKKKAYGVVYHSPIPAKGEPAPVEWTARLVETKDGVDYRTVTQLDIHGRPNEATVRFLTNDQAVMLIRREAEDKAAWIGIASPPYDKWKWKSAGFFIGGPNFVVLPDDQMIAAGRQMLTPKNPRLFVGRMSLDQIEPQLVLPSGGDCSYPGLVVQDETLWVSYYSSHEGKAKIYLAKLKLASKPPKADPNR